MAASDEQAAQFTQQFRADYAKVVAKAWSDEAFKARLLADPYAALNEAGVEVPAGVTAKVKVVENTSDTVHLVLPPPPPEGELTDEDLDKVAGGLAGCNCCQPIDISQY